MSQAQISNNMAIAGTRRRRVPSPGNVTWTGWACSVLPVVTLFLILPSLNIFIRSFQSRIPAGSPWRISPLFSVAQICAMLIRQHLNQPDHRHRRLDLWFYWPMRSAYRVAGGFRTFLLTFSGVASNFAGRTTGVCLHRHHWHAGLVTRWIEAITRTDIHAVASQSTPYGD